LNAIFTHYKNYCENDFENAVKKELSGNLAHAMLTIVKAVKSKPNYFAELIHESVEGLGVRENDLVEILVRRSNVSVFFK
jgi:hypothetical protein